MLSVARGLTLVVSQGTPLPTPDMISFLGSDIGRYLPLPLLIMLGLLDIPVLILAARTPAARCTHRWQPRGRHGVRHQRCTGNGW